MKKRLIILSLCIVISSFSLWALSEAATGTKIIKKVFDNGLTLLVKPNPANEVVAVSVYLRMGSLYERRDQAGISVLTHRVETRGTSTRNAWEIALETESVGATIKAVTGFDYGLVTLTTTTIGLEKGLAVLLDILQNPVFPQDQLEKERKILLDQIAAREDQPFDTAFIAFMEAFYGNHPYAMLPSGSAKVVQKLSRDDLLAWRRKVYVPNNMVISIVGKVDPQAMVEIFNNTLGKLPSGEVPAKQTADLTARVIDRPVFKQRKSEALFMVLGYPAPDLLSKDAPAMEVLNGLLGADMSSRLFVELREKQGLAYSVSSDFQKMNGPSCIYCFMATAPENYQTARDGIMAQFERLMREDVPAKELVATKRYIKGRYLMGHETNLDQANIMGQYELMGLGYEYDFKYPKLIDKVSAGDIRRLAKQYFQHYTLAVVAAEEIN